MNPKNGADVGQTSVDKDITFIARKKIKSEPGVFSTAAGLKKKHFFFSPKHRGVSHSLDTNW